MYILKIILDFYIKLFSVRCKFKDYEKGFFINQVIQYFIKIGNVLDILDVNCFN